MATTPPSATSPHAVPEVHWNTTEDKRFLKTGLHHFIFIDGAGRRVPIWYHLPKTFVHVTPGECKHVNCDSDDEEEDGRSAAETRDREDSLEDPQEEVVGNIDDEPSAAGDDSASKEPETVMMDLEGNEGKGDAGKTMAELYGWQPELVLGQEDNQIIFVCHGVLRNAETYCKVWRKFSTQHNFLLICPEFTEEYFPNVRNYQLGNMVNAKGQPLPLRKWSFTVIEDVFKLMRRAGIRRSGYGIYGHSAGAQFVHRLVQFLPHSHVETAVAANPGWYTVPDLHIPFPYGWKGLPIDNPEAQMRMALSRNMVLLLGQEDVKTMQLRTTPPAMRQGITRLDRGLNFYAAARSLSYALGGDTVLAWVVRTVAGVGHSDKGMGGYAVHEMVYTARILKEACVGGTRVINEIKFDPSMVADPPPEVIAPCPPCPGAHADGNEGAGHP